MKRALGGPAEATATVGGERPSEPCVASRPSGFDAWSTGLPRGLAPGPCRAQSVQDCTREKAGRRSSAAAWCARRLVDPDVNRSGDVIAEDTGKPILRLTQADPDEAAKAEHRERLAGFQGGGNEPPGLRECKENSRATRFDALSKKNRSCWMNFEHVTTRHHAGQGNGRLSSGARRKH